MHCPAEPCENLDKQHQLFVSHGICISYLSFCKRQKASAGTVLRRCFSEIDSFRDRMGRKLCVFKVGLTSNPIVRFSFYKDANYTHMSLLHVSHNLGLCQMLEAALIASNLSERGCRNQRYGGEGPPSAEQEPFHFVYIVGARADQFKAIRWTANCCIQFAADQIALSNSLENGVAHASPAVFSF